MLVWVNLVAVPTTLVANEYQYIYLRYPLMSIDVLFKSDPPSITGRSQKSQLRKRKITVTGLFLN